MTRKKQIIYLYEGDILERTDGNLFEVVGKEVANGDGRGVKLRLKTLTGDLKGGDFNIWCDSRDMTMYKKKEKRDNEVAVGNVYEGGDKEIFEVVDITKDDNMETDVVETKVLDAGKSYKREGQVIHYPLEYMNLFKEVEVSKNEDEEHKVVNNDVVNQPPHYTYGGIEVIDYVEQVTRSYKPSLAFAIGNVVKYVSRAPFKNGVEDLKKAKWYLERVIEKWEDENDENQN